MIVNRVRGLSELERPRRRSRRAGRSGNINAGRSVFFDRRVFGYFQRHAERQWGFADALDRAGLFKIVIRDFLLRYAFLRS